MTKLGFVMSMAAATLLFGPGPEKALAQGQFQKLTGAASDAAVPDTVPIAGMNMPVQKRNAAVVQSPAGTRAFLGLTDCTGYGSDVAKKYAGAIITERGSLSIGGKTIAPGVYGFGFEVPPRGEEGPGKFLLYSRAGAKLGEATSPRDGELKTPVPLQVVILPGGTARLYFGRHSVELR
jgi:hypothetical protein